jgi:hypothetical protein
MLRGMAESLIKVVQMIGPGLHVMGLARNDIESDVIKAIHKGGRIGHISQSGGAVVARFHIENAKYASAIGEVNLAGSERQIVASISRI